MTTNQTSGQPIEFVFGIGRCSICGQQADLLVLGKDPDTLEEGQQTIGVGICKSCLSRAYDTAIAKRQADLLLRQKRKSLFSKLLGSKPSK